MTTTSKTNKRGHKEDFSVKVFEPKPSILTDLFDENKYLKSLYNLCFSLAVSVIISNSITNYQKEQKFYLGSKIIISAFRNFDIALIGWSCLFLSTNLIYGGLRLWAGARKTLKSKLWDTLWLVLYVFYLLSLLFYSGKFAIVYDLGVASSLALLMEATRLVMKSHAFVRSNCPKYLTDDQEEILHPTYSHYIYFSFAPTIVYRDSYPKSNEPVQWRSVFKWFSELFAGTVLFSILYENAYVIPLKDCGLKQYSLMDLFVVQIQTTHIALVLFLLFFYCGSHSLFNGAGEMLKFSDRVFYKDWWMSTTVDRSLRTWNIFVHDWLYLYVYKDFHDHVFSKNRILSRVMVLLVSAIFHDFIIMFSGRLYIPVCTISFTGLAVLMRTRPFIRNINNICFWLGLGFLISGKLTFLTAEFFARSNCPLETITFLDNFKLRLLSC